MRGGGSLLVLVGRPFTFTRDEERKLRELATTMQRLTQYRRAGWRRELVLAHTQMSRIMHLALSRGQDNPDVVEHS